MSNFLLITFIGIAAALGLTGCFGDREPAKTEIIKSAKVAAPKFTTTTPICTVGKVAMTISPTEVATARQSLPANIREAATWFTTQPGSRNYEVSYQLLEMPAKDGVDFRFEVVNDGDTALTFEKAIIGISINGRLVNLTQDKYAGLHKVAVPPKARTGDIFFPGYSLTQHEKGKVKIDISNVQIGTEMANFTWTLDAADQLLPLTCSVSTTTQLMQPNQATAFQAQSHQIEQQLKAFDAWYAIAVEKK